MSEQNTVATQEATQPESSEPGKTFTQEDVNRIVQERLARERNRVPSDAEKTLEEREKAVAARERESADKAVRKSKNIPEEVYEALNCASEDAFNKSLEILSPYFQKAREPIFNAVGPTNGTNTDSVRAAMGLK